MTASAGFIAIVAEGLGALGPISVRRMFGGAGVFRDGVMFALIADDTIYLKADEDSQQAFMAEGLSPFSYETKNGRNTIMSYWRAPDRLLDEPDELVEWASRALAAAMRAQRTRSASKGRSTPRR